MANKVTETAEQTEKFTEKLRLWQIIISAIVGFSMAFVPMLVTYVDKTCINPPTKPIQCEGNISITYPKNKMIVYGEEVEVAGVVNPREGCQNVFLIVGTVDGHNYFTTDSVTVNPDGTWDAIAKLYFVPQGARARIQARLCGEANAYPPESCLPQLPNRGVASNSVVISRQAGVPIKKIRSAKSHMGLGVLEFTNNFASGSATGLNGNYRDYKVVIYYKDSQFGWIKQPYPGDREGYGWAAILPNGEWSIQLRERPTSGDDVVTRKCIILMKKNDPSPDRTQSLRDIKAVVKEIR